MPPFATEHTFCASGGSLLKQRYAVYEYGKNRSQRGLLDSKRKLGDKFQSGNFAKCHSLSCTSYLFRIIVA